MNYPDREINDYCASVTSPPDDNLYQLERTTWLSVLSPQMIAGHVQGTFLKFISQMIRPMRVMEVGTFTGYSAICLAEGIPDGGSIDTIEGNHEMEPIASRFVSQSPHKDKIRFHWGDALAIMPTLEGPYDLIFLDANKLQYEEYYQISIPLLRQGGFLLADNTLWSGRVLKPEGDMEAKAMDDFNRMVNNDPRVENMLLPLRDGIMMVRKK